MARRTRRGGNRFRTSKKRGGAGCGKPVVCNTSACKDLISGALNRNLSIYPAGVASRIQSAYPQSGQRGAFLSANPMQYTLANQINNLSNIGGGGKRRTRGGKRRTRGGKRRRRSNCGCVTY